MFVFFLQIGLRLHLPSKTKNMSPQERHDTYKKYYDVSNIISIDKFVVVARPD